MLDIAILGLLMERDHHGYELRVQLRDRLGLTSNVSFGSIYPALARLERHGSVETVTGPDGRLTALSTGSLSGERATLRSLRTTSGLGRRGRKVYRITERGRQEFARLLADPTTIDSGRSFSLRVALARYLTPALRVTLLDRRRVALLERLEELRASTQAPDLDAYVRAVIEHGARAIEFELAWVDELRAQEHRTQDKDSYASDAS
ncbi:MAG: helix-turn-helix transcriptional regulator [Acidimicrobiales bacterium]